MKKLVLALFCTACGTDGDSESDALLGPEPVCDTPRDLTCTDTLVTSLGLQDDKVSEGAVTTQVEGADFVSAIDATAGGLQGAATNPWVYVRFTPTGLEKLDLTDEQALTSMDWHLAAKRFILRLNGGSSGPACVGAAPLLEGDYTALAAAPAGLTFGQDAFLTDDCTLINDSSGLPGSPQVVLSPWWSYPGCVATTGVPFVVQTPSGDLLKLRVESYYASGQDTCNDAGTPGSGSGNFTVRWAWLDPA